MEELSPTRSLGAIEQQLDEILNRRQRV